MSAPNLSILSRNFRFDSAIPTRGIDQTASPGKVWPGFGSRCFQRRREGPVSPPASTQRPERALFPGASADTFPCAPARSHLWRAFAAGYKCEVRMVPSLGAGVGAWCPAVSRRKKPCRKNGVGGGSRTLTSRQAQRIFIPSTAFAARMRRFEASASGLRSGLSLHRPPIDPGLRCCPSSLYTFPVGMLDAATSGSMPSGLGSGLPFQVSPNLGSSASPVSHANSQVSLSP